MRRLALLFAGLVAMVAAAYAVYWHEIADGLRRNLDPWAEARRAEGYAIAWQSAELDGFPFRFRLRFAGAALRASRPVPYAASSDEIVLTAQPWNLQRWRLAAPRGASVEALPALAGIAVAELTGTLAQRDGAIAITLSAHEIAGRRSADGFAAAALEAKIDLPARAPSTDRDTDLALALSLSQVDLPHFPTPLARRFDSIAIQAALKGAVPPGPLDRALAQWRDAGGTLEVESAHAAAGDMSIDVAGTLALDEAMQPVGAFTAIIIGGDRIIDEVVASGAVQSRYAGFAKSVLHAISAPGANGADAAHVPLTLQDQRLYIGPAQIAALPRFTWQ